MGPRQKFYPYWNFNTIFSYRCTIVECSYILCHGSGQVLPARGSGHEIIEVLEEASVQPLSIQSPCAFTKLSCWNDAKSAGGGGPKPAEPSAAGGVAN